MQATSYSLIGGEYSDCNILQNIRKASEHGMGKPQI
jgi:hypothetical protein